MTERGSPADDQFLYLTTTGRRTGKPHEIEIWFGGRGKTLYILAGGREKSDTVQNIIANPAVSVRVGGRSFAATGRVLQPGAEDALARSLLLEKYAPTYSGDLKEWGETALPVALDIGEEIG
jgi:deazaflavin-dependent oxidoreductase (nitroreductase family)